MYYISDVYILFYGYYKIVYLLSSFTPNYIYSIFINAVYYVFYPFIYNK